MDAIGDMLEWIQGAIEQRCGKVWAWTTYGLLLCVFFGTAIWIIRRF